MMGITDIHKMLTEGGLKSSYLSCSPTNLNPTHLPLMVRNPINQDEEMFPDKLEPVWINLST